MSTVMSWLPVTNRNDDFGGGIFADGGVLFLVDSVVSGNESTSDGGGIYAIDGAETEIIRSEISLNTALSGNGDASPSVNTGGATGTGGSASAQGGPASASGTGSGSGTAGAAASRISPHSTGSGALR